MAVSRFLDAYYLFNGLLVAAYLPLHLYFRLITPDGSDHGQLHSIHEFTRWETQAFTSYALILAWQVMRRRSWDHYAQNVFFYGKIITALTAYQVDSRLLAWYGLLCWVASAVCPQPMCQLFTPESQEVVGLDPMRTKDLVLNGGTDVNWVVYLYAEQHSPSTAMAPAFAEIAKEYGGPKLKFGCLEATLWPHFTRDALKVSPSTYTAHLPATLLFMRGKEAARLPRPEDIDEIGLKRNHYTKSDVIKKLGLDKFR